MLNELGSAWKVIERIAEVVLYLSKLGGATLMLAVAAGYVDMPSTHTLALLLAVALLPLRLR